LREEGQQSLDPSDWPRAVSQYMHRIVDIVLFYDSGFHSGIKSGIEHFQLLAHGCLTGPEEMVICTEALSLAKEVEIVKNGRIVVFVGYTRFSIQSEEGCQQHALLADRTFRREAQIRPAYSRKSSSASAILCVGSA